MQKWEYRTEWVYVEGQYPIGPGGKTQPMYCIRVDDDPVPLNQALDTFGEDGWEMVAATISVSHHWLYFKRPKASS